MNTVDEELVKGRTAERRASVGVVVGILVLCLFLPPLVAGLPVRGQRALLVALITITLWTARSLDSGAVALLGVTLLALTGTAATLRQALQGFASPVPYFLIGVLALGVAVAKSGLAMASTSWMTLVAYATILLVALPYWRALGEPLMSSTR